MKPIFLTSEQIFGSEEHPDSALPLFSAVGTVAPPSDLALLTVEDDGFAFEAGGGINYYLSQDSVADRFGRLSTVFICPSCAVRPAILLDPEEETLLHNLRTDGSVTTAEYGLFPTAVLDRSMRDLAAKNLLDHSLYDTGRHITVRNKQYPVYRLGAKRVIVITVESGGANGYLTLSDSTVVSEGEQVFLELRPVRWLYDPHSHILISVQCLFAGLSAEEAASYLSGPFLRELAPEQEAAIPADAPFRLVQHDELSLIRAYVDADIPVFLHGLSGDGKSDRVRQIDPQALDIELVNETPETINGRAVYNEEKDEIIDIKPAWLIRLERLCKNGEQHILFFDELTNATKQTQSVIFKIVLERFVNNRWPLPASARIVAAGNDRSTSARQWRTGCHGQSAAGSIPSLWSFWPITTSISARPIPAPKAMRIRGAGRWPPVPLKLPETTSPFLSPSSAGMPPRLSFAFSVRGRNLQPSAVTPMRSSVVSALPASISWRSSA